MVGLVPGFGAIDEEEGELYPPHPRHIVVSNNARKIFIDVLPSAYFFSGRYQPGERRVSADCYLFVKEMSFQVRETHVWKTKS
jgi:hypothetical protein